MDWQKEKFIDIPPLDRDIIKGHTWAEEMWTVLEDGLKRTFLYWCQMVIQMGEPIGVVKDWTKTFVKTHEENCCELISDMARVHGNVLLKIEQLLKKTEQLCHTLQIDMPVLGDVTGKLSLYQEQCELKKRIEEYEKLIAVRCAAVHKLREKQLDLCNSLGKEPRSLRDNPLPSSEEIDEFHRYLEKLEMEKFNRLKKFISVKGELLEIVSELKIKPSSQFEKDVFSLDESEFVVTDTNMKELDLLQKNLIKRQKDINEEISQLRNKVEDYWNLFDVALKERENFQQKHTGNSLDILHILRDELKRCETMKKANIKVFTDKLRFELEELWEKCQCSQIMKGQFRFFYSDCYNEDLLELHEIETAKWKKYYEDNKELLALLEKHQKLWNKMVELEENATGPDRFNNRGGQLLKEEKERNKLAKQIPQIEKKLYDLSEKHEEHRGVAFTTFGRTVAEYLGNLHEERENAKKMKLSTRKMQREQVLTPAKSAQNLFPSTSTQTTPLSATKRKLPTPKTDVPKRVKVLSERNNNNDNSKHK